MVGDRQFVDVQRPPPGVGDALQIFQILPGQRILRVGLVVGPGKHHGGGRHKGADIVHMFVGLVLVDPAGQPEHLFRAKPGAEGLLDLLTAHPGIPPGREQTALGHEQRPLTVAVDAAAFQNKGRRIGAGYPQRTAESRRHRIVLLPVGIQPVHQPAPGVEGPADAPQFPGVIFDKGRAHIPGPGVVALNFQHRHAGQAGGGRPGLFGLIRGSQQVQILAPGNGLKHPHKGLLGRAGVLPPAARPHRPDHQSGPVRGILGRHRKPLPVSWRQRHGNPPLFQDKRFLKSSYPKWRITAQRPSSPRQAMSGSGIPLKVLFLTIV